MNLLGGGNIKNFEFRVCSNINFENVEQAIDYIHKFGVDRDFFKADNLVWSARSRIYGRGLQKGAKEIIIAYRDPKDLTEPRYLDEGAMSYHKLVLAKTTLRDLIVDGGGVVIFS